jgi:hypothetical protein
MSDNLERSSGNGSSQNAFPDLKATVQTRKSPRVLLTFALTFILGIATYLRLSGIRVGLLLNFNQVRVTDNLLRRVV